MIAAIATTAADASGIAMSKSVSIASTVDKLAGEVKEALGTQNPINNLVQVDR